MLTALAYVTSAVLVCFALRRSVLLVAATLPRASRAAGEGDPPTVTLVVPACNEESGIDRTLAALDRLDYPPERLFTVLVDDCSDDATREHLVRWAADRPCTAVLRLDRRGGKARAVNAALAAAPATDLVAVCDADVRPRSGYLRRLVVVFADPTVGGATGFLAPTCARTTPIARYAAVESWVNQLVTSAGKDRLDLNPPTLGGGSAFRRAALEQVGWFAPGTSGDDVRITVALTRAGWRTRFVPEAVADNPVVTRWTDYWCQHVRWARDLFAALPGQPRPGAGIPLRRRLEAWMLSAGYADRLALVAGLVLGTTGHLPLSVPVTYLSIVAAGVCVAIVQAGAASRLPSLLLWTATFLLLDVAATLVAAAAHLLRRPRARSTPRRAPA